MKHYPADDKSTVRITVNGTAYEASIEPRKLLSDFIREDCGLTGTHVGCEHGICGSCTVLINGVPARSCLTFAVQADGDEIQTIEGIAVEPLGKLLADEFKDHHALQCGYCTPGILASTYSMLQETDSPDRGEISDMLSGHICRCTGYTSIIDAIEHASKKNDSRSD